MNEWRAIEERLRPFIARRVATAAEIDDVVQEVLARVVRATGPRDAQRGGAWLFAIARNAVADHYRDRARHPLAQNDPRDEAADEAVDAADAQWLDQEMLACVARFVALLPDEPRQAITLVELEGMSQKEAAGMLGITHSGMKSRVQRAREALRGMFERACALELDARRKVIDCEPRSAACSPLARAPAR